MWIIYEINFRLEGEEGRYCIKHLDEKWSRFENGLGDDYAIKLGCFCHPICSKFEHVFFFFCGYNF